MATARKSTGPKTEEGTLRSRLNALKHGLRSKNADPVLPHEDPAELADRIQEWFDAYEPVDAVERELVVRAAKASWSLDRAERSEAALLARQVRRSVLRSTARRTEEALVHARKLLYMTGSRKPPITGPPWADDPAAFVLRLEESPEGAAWMRDRWLELSNLLDAPVAWTYHDQFKFIRLLGKQPVDGVDDVELNAIFLAWETVQEGSGVNFWRRMQDFTPVVDPAFTDRRAWRELGPRPDSPASALAFLKSIAKREAERLDALIAELEEIEGVDALERAERASFASTEAAERLRRFQTARTREMLRMIEMLMKLRKARTAREAPSRRAEKATNESRPSPAPAPAPVVRESAESAEPVSAVPAPIPSPAAAPVRDSEPKSKPATRPIPWRFSGEGTDFEENRPAVAGVGTLVQPFSASSPTLSLPSRWETDVSGRLWGSF